MASERILTRSRASSVVGSYRGGREESGVIESEERVSAEVDRGVGDQDSDSLDWSGEKYE